MCMLQKMSTTISANISSFMVPIIKIHAIFETNPSFRFVTLVPTNSEMPEVKSVSN